MAMQLMKKPIYSFSNNWIKSVILGLPASILAQLPKNTPKIKLNKPSSLLFCPISIDFRAKRV